MYIFAATDLETQISTTAVRTVLISASALLVLVIIAAVFKDRYKFLKLPLFLAMCMSIIGSTLLLFGTTIYLNVKSDSGGPVHYHADLEFWACGNELELVNPQSRWSNKVGTATLHEHNDKRIHLEGVVVDESYDESLGKFMSVVGGSLDAAELLLPLDPSLYSALPDGDGSSNPNPSLITQYITDYEPISETSPRYKPGTKMFRSDMQMFKNCGNKPAQVQVFVYSYDSKSKTYSQRKLYDPSAYTYARESNVPAGDCIIVEFDEYKDRTDKLCKQYGVKDADRCDKFGVTPEKKSKICKLREVQKDDFSEENL